MASFIAEPANLEAFNILASHPLIDVQRRTPGFQVHVLHFIAAKLGLVLQQHAVEHSFLSLLSIKTIRTALLYTSLHVACLPPTDSDVNWCSGNIYESIHDVRTTD
ncbi:hypothetical protein BX600DRAFT_467031 [Xylariales sp. PMI_506]|nr:hypothetical protein BX600DRAFT_467031 [Xylariales sp. PMI_506]